MTKRTTENERFEDWCKNRGMTTAIWGGMYASDETFASWKIWEAACASHQSYYSELLAECAAHASNADSFADQIEVLTKQVSKLENENASLRNMTLLDAKYRQQRNELRAAAKPFIEIAVVIEQSSGNAEKVLLQSLYIESLQDIAMLRSFIYGGQQLEALSLLDKIKEDTGL